MKPKVAIVRGKFLNRYEMQFFEPLTAKFDLTAFGSLRPFHDKFAFPVIKLPSPMDLPEFPYKMPILNRLIIDAHYLLGLERRLKGFDLVHTAETYFHYTQQCLNAKKKGYVRKVIATVLENIPFNNESIWGRKEYKRRAREELDHIIALTQKTRDALVEEGADPGKITIIPHFVDTGLFAPSQKAVTRRFSRSQRELTILFCGRLEEYKGVLDVLEAARILLSDEELKHYLLRFIFAGAGSLLGKMKDMETQYRIDKKVEHLNVPYDDMPRVYDQGDIFVAPSKPTPTYEEQYCTALLEAQAAGLPIVTTRTGGIPENIGAAGVVVTPGDVAAIAAAIKTFIKTPRVREAYGRKARKRAKTTHDISIGASLLAKLYRRVLRDK